MGPDYEACRERLSALIAWVASQGANLNRNEATTRLHLINNLLFECLGWSEADCIAEERLDGVLSDYSLFAPQRLLIVEAKKESVYFELPAGQKKLIWSIKTFQKDHPDLFQAIEQAAEYCQKRGTPFGAVCNGHQLVAFLGSRVDGRRPVEGDALVFTSLEIMYEQFLALWDSLSKPGVQEYRLSVELQKGESPAPPEKLSARILNYPGYKLRNELQTYLQQLGDLVIDELAAECDELEFLRQCYCSSDALSQYALTSKSILKSRYSALYQQSVSGPKLVPLKQKTRLNADALAFSVTRRPILLLGDVGVGKTIFMQHFIKLDAADVLNKSIVIYIDFLTHLGVGLAEHVHDVVQVQLRELYGVDIEEAGFVRTVYHKELERFDRSIYAAALKESDPDEFRRKQLIHLEAFLTNRPRHVQACISYIQKGMGRQVVVFLDNVDHHLPPTQEEAFRIAQGIADSWQAAVFLAMRPETFYASKQTGAISAYHPKAFTIAPAPTCEVIVKRLDYAAKLLGENRLPGLPAFEVQLNSLHAYLNVIARSFKQSRDLAELIDNICGGNSRLALEFVRVFLGSGHVDTAKILEEQQTYIVPVHELLRAVIFRDHENYNPASSEIVNIFDISSPDGREHFLMPLLLAQTDRWKVGGTSEGYVSRARLTEFAQGLGFAPRQIEFALQRALTKKLIESNTKGINGAAAAGTHVRLTTVGAYYYRRLISMFTYVDAMSVDTPITDAAFRRQISDVRPIEQRLDRAERFLSYLDEQWRAIPQSEVAFDWQATRSELAANIADIRVRASRRRERQTEAQR